MQKSKNVLMGLNPKEGVSVTMEKQIPRQEEGKRLTVGCGDTGDATVTSCEETRRAGTREASGYRRVCSFNYRND